MIVELRIEVPDEIVDRLRAYGPEGIAETLIEELSNTESRMTPWPN